MRYPCLILDHDDTVVNSTDSIHYPAFVEYLKQARPEKSYTLEDYLRINFDPGFLAFYRDVLHFTEAEVDAEFACWQEFVRTRIPKAYPGIREILLRHRARGGVFAVVSHSVGAIIERDYRENDLPLPDLVFGWELAPDKRKPNVWPVRQVMDTYGFTPDQVLVIDDLKPGFDMARAAGVDFAAALWAHDIPQIRGFMRKNCDFAFDTVRALADFLESEEES